MYAVKESFMWYDQYPSGSWLGSILAMCYSVDVISYTFPVM